VLRGGLPGGLAAWAAFTLPSALLLYAAARVSAWAATALTGPLATGLVHGLKLAAVAVVAQAVWGMSRTLTPDRPRAVIALAAAAASLVASGTPGQLVAIMLGAAAGLCFCRGPAAAPAEQLHVPVTRRHAAAALALFATLLAASALLAAATGNRAVMLFDAFYRSGALVFGGGHVVLPVLRAAVVGPGWVGNSTFLAGYGLAQAVPGPLFTLAAYLGAFSLPSPAPGAAIALIALSLPGLLLVYGALPFWHGIRTRPAAQAGMRGTNAAVLGILAAALYTPLCTSTIGGLPDAALAAIAFLALTRAHAPPWLVVAALAAAGTLPGLATSFG
jgi:chromate transporter